MFCPGAGRRAVVCVVSERAGPPVEEPPPATPEVGAAVMPSRADMATALPVVVRICAADVKVMANLLLLLLLVCNVRRMAAASSCWEPRWKE